MPKQSVEALVEGGKATAAPPLGPALGPLGVNISSIIGEINKKTAAFGHFGRTEPEFTWERTDKAAALRAGAGL